MGERRSGDLILQALPILNGRQRYILVNAATLRREDGPFESVEDAVIAAIEVATKQRITVWQQPVDERGRPHGAPKRLFTTAGPK